VKKLLYLFVGFVLALLLFFPQASEVAPALHLQVLDEQGNPAGGVLTVQEWGLFGIDRYEEEHRRTDEDGFVDYPQRIVRASLFSRSLAFAGGLFSHGGLGPYASVWAFGADPHVWIAHNCSVTIPAPPQIRLSRRTALLQPDRRHLIPDNASN
jgi:hypothetical protein